MCGLCIILGGVNPMVLFPICFYNPKSIMVHVHCCSTKPCEDNIHKGEYTHLTRRIRGQLGQYNSKTGGAQKGWFSTHIWSSQQQSAWMIAICMSFGAGSPPFFYGSRFCMGKYEYSPAAILKCCLELACASVRWTSHDRYSFINQVRANLVNTCTCFSTGRYDRL